jgi:opacity protein-like surface antigen
MKFLMSAAAILLIGLSTTMAQSDGEDYEPVSVTLGGKERIPRTFDAYLVGGYGIPIGGKKLEDIYSHLEQPNSEVNDSIVEEHELNYGKGLKIEAGAAWYLMAHLGLEASFEYSRYLPRLEVRNENTAQNAPNWTEEYTIQMFGPKLMVKPVFTPFQFLRLYAAGGAGVLFTKLEYTNTAPDYSHVGYIETTPGLTLDAVLGTDIPFNDRVAAVIAFSLQRVYFTTTERKDPQNDRIHVVDEKYSSGVNPFQEPPKHIPGNNMAVHAGVRIRIF